MEGSSSLRRTSIVASMKYLEMEQIPPEKFAGKTMMNASKSTITPTHHEDSLRSSFSLPENSIVVSDTSMQDVPISPMKLPKMRTVQQSLSPRRTLSAYSSASSSSGSSRPQSPLDSLPPRPFNHSFDVDDDTVTLEHFQPLDMDVSYPNLEYFHDTDADDYRGGICQPRKKKEVAFQVGDHVFQGPPETEDVYPPFTMLDAVTNYDVYGSMGGKGGFIESCWKETEAFNSYRNHQL